MIITNIVVYADTVRGCLAAANLETGMIVFDGELEGLKFEAIYAHRKGIKASSWPLLKDEMEKWMKVMGRCESIAIESDRDGNLYEFWSLK